MEQNELKKSYLPCKGLICESTDKQKKLIYYWKIKFYVEHGKVVESKFVVHEVNSSKQKPLLKPNIERHTSTRASPKNDLDKQLLKCMDCSFYGKTMDNVQKRIKVKFIKKDDGDKMLRSKSKSTFNGLDESFHSFDTYTFKHIETLME